LYEIRLDCYPAAGGVYAHTQACELFTRKCGMELDLARLQAQAKAIGDLNLGDSWLDD